MLSIIFLLAFWQPPALPPSPNQNVPATVESDPDLDKAQALYAEGSTLYEAADYRGAIDKFTAALSLVSAGSDDLTRQALLYNIARAHEKAHEIDKDIRHLRQALTLYRRYEAYAKKHTDQEDQRGVAERIRLLETSLKEHDVSAQKSGATPGHSTDLPAPVRWKRPRNVGVGLVVSGSAMVVGGIVTAVLGSRYEPNARSQVAKLDDLGVPAEHPARAEGAEFIRQEHRKGRMLMGVGGAFAGSGAVLLGVGTYYLVKAKRLKIRAVPTTSYFGLSFQGRF